MSFATKLSHVVYAEGTEADIMKSPTGDTSKISFPGDALSPSASRSVSECISSQCLRVKCHVQCLNHASDFCSSLKLQDPMRPVLLRCFSRLTPRSLFHVCLDFWSSLGHLQSTQLSSRTAAGALAVKRVDGVPTIFPAEGGHVPDEENLLQTLYDCGPVQVDQSAHDYKLCRIVNDMTKYPHASELPCRETGRSSRI